MAFTTFTFYFTFAGTRLQEKWRLILNTAVTSSFLVSIVDDNLFLEYAWTL